MHHYALEDHPLSSHWHWMWRCRKLEMFRGMQARKSRADKIGPDIVADKISTTCLKT
jgi:hypothetical protein